MSDPLALPVPDPMAFKIPLGRAMPDSRHIYGTYARPLAYPMPESLAFKNSLGRAMPSPQRTYGPYAASLGIPMEPMPHPLASLWNLCRTPWHSKCETPGIQTEAMPDPAAYKQNLCTQLGTPPNHNPQKHCSADSRQGQCWTLRHSSARVPALKHSPENTPVPACQH